MGAVMKVAIDQWTGGVTAAVDTAAVSVTLDERGLTIRSWGSVSVRVTSEGLAIDLDGHPLVFLWSQIRALSAGKGE